MLDTDTKRRIDTARDILVGKVPDPKSQVEQITIALIYKFMDDMDAESEEFGGVRKFFAGDFARYGWAKLMRSGLGGHETLNLYAEAIARMPENPGIPLLFRDIFKNAYLPYRDPETLRAFLKIIDEFNYDHSEKLGDAFEYLLSVLGSQGDAGQFRTPRHIIDFMVAVIDPKKNDKVLDPACGTAGFLISAYKHILKTNLDAKGHSTLTPEEKGKLAENFIGYDISPDMVRLSLVNMYLHGFTDPHIYEYDTLTSQEHWKDYADVILANPPFMSPKGGIIPHKRFSVQSKRSEVLFVDYMAEHLTTNGRAAIIVPEGIIFQSGTAYKQLRQLLVDKYLIAVVSLPAGVFQPYSGVKTSIIILDASLAKKTSDIAFFKVDNDGFGLGAQRRESEKNDLPQVLEAITNYKLRITNGESVTTAGLGIPDSQCVIVPKEKIAANGDYNLSGERYREDSISLSSFPSIELGKICELVRGVVFAKEDEVSEGGMKVLRANNINRNSYELNLSDIKQVVPKVKFSNDKKLKKDDIFICLASGSKDHIGKVAFIKEDTDFYFGGFMGAIRVNKEHVLADYLLKQLTTGHFNNFLREQIAGANINNLSSGILYKFQIPLPPIEVQKEIVAEIERYQKVIDGARIVVDNYQPHISVDADWPMVELGKVCDVKTGKLNSNATVENGIYPFFTCSKDIFKIDNYAFDCEAVLLSGNNASGDFDVKYYHGKFNAYQRTYIITIKTEYINNMTYGILKYILHSNLLNLKLKSIGGLTRYLTLNMITSIKLPMPSIAIQQNIAAEIEEEQALVNANKELIERMEKKIQGVLARVWGEGK
jgi:type I restriction enzyme M protein